MSRVSFASPSATVVLVRRGQRDPELFMVQRHERSSFGSAYAFPGGVVEEDDARVHQFCTGLSILEADAHLGVRGDGLDLYTAAIRELFEETGVLLADTDRIDENLQAVRDALNDGSDRWSDFVERNELGLQCDRLHYIAHWITPQAIERRYSTRFFLAEIPEGQHASHCGGELTASRWATAHDMLEAGRAGDVELHFPTIKTLESIARHKSIEDLVDWARSCVEWGVTTMLPALIMRDGEPEIVLPGDRDYPGVKS